jgi:hypothetical protein
MGIRRWHRPQRTRPDSRSRQVAATPTPGHKATVRRRPLVLSYERLVNTGVPVPSVEYLASVDPRMQHCRDRRVLDPNPVLDVPVAEVRRPQAEYFPHALRIIVRHQQAVPQVITRLRPVDPLTLPNRPLIAHLHVLGQLLPEELSESAKDVIEHPSRRRRWTYGAAAMFLPSQASWA